MRTARQVLPGLRFFPYAVQRKGVGQFAGGGGTFGSSPEAHHSGKVRRFQPTLFMTVRREIMQSPSETGG
jgi:hypothetical protein